MNYFRKGFQLQSLTFLCLELAHYLQSPVDPNVLKPVTVVELSLIGLPEGSVTPVVTLILYAVGGIVAELSLVAGLTSNVLLSLLELGLPVVI